MLYMFAVCISAILIVLSVLCYLQRFWHFKDIKGFKGGFPWPLVMDGFNFRNSQKMTEYLLSAPKKFGHKGFKFSIGFDNFLCLLDGEDLKAVVNSEELITKGRDYRFVEPLFGKGLGTSTGKKWKQHRKLLNPTFHSSILREFVQTFDTIGDVLIENLERKINEGPIDVFKIVSLYSLDVVCETTLGVPLALQKNDDQKYIVATKAALRMYVERAFSWWKRFDFPYNFTSEYKTFLSLCDWTHNYVNNIIYKRRQTLTECDDSLIVVKKKILLDVLIKSTIDGEPLSNKDIRDEAQAFMSAGHDTSAAALSFCLYCLSQHPEIQERLFKEQKEVLGDAVHATYEHLQKMTYLEMVVKEVMRLYPPVPAVSREVQEDLTMNFGTLKKGLQVIIFPMGLHRIPEYFPDPEKFDPERFSPENINNIKPFTYLPFSAGYRNCIGQIFAMLSMKSALSKIVRNFKIYPDLTYKPILLYEITLRTQNGVRIIIEKRP